MSFNLKRISEVDNKSKFAVSGFIHQHEILLSKQCVFYSNIPIFVNHITLCYYYDKDKFDINKFNLDGYKFSIYKNGMNNYSDNGCLNGILSNIINKGKYRWTFKIHKMSFRSSIHIGIFKINSGDIDFWEPFYDKKSGYAFSVERASIIQSAIFVPYGVKSQCDEKGYAVKCDEGDIISMILDMDNYTLSYIINGINYGIAFNNIDNTKYKAGIYTNNGTVFMFNDETIDQYRGDMSYNVCVELIRSGYLLKERDYRIRGICTKFNINKRYGFITINNGYDISGDLFVHYTDIKEEKNISFRRLEIGELVEFDVMLQNDGREKAVNVISLNVDNNDNNNNIKLIRKNIAKKFGDILKHKEAGNNLEKRIYKLNDKEINDKYKSRANDLIYKLKKNNKLLQNVLNGNITIKQLSLMK